MIEDLKKRLKKFIGKNTPLFAISAVSGDGISELLREMVRICDRVSVEQAPEEEILPTISLQSTDDAWKIEKTSEGFVVKGAKIERFALRTDFENDAGIERLRDIMRKMGIMHELERRKINPGDRIIIGPDEGYGEFEY
jgi:GTP-binding protein